MAAKKKSKGSSPPPLPTDAELKRAVEGKDESIAPAAALKALVGREAATTGTLARIAREPERQEALRTTAAVALGRRSTAAARAALMELLEDEDPQVVRRAAQGLGRVGGEEAYERLKAMRPREPVVRRAFETAKTLLAYRLDAKGGRLSPREPSERIELDAKVRTRDFRLRTLGAEAVEALRPVVAEEVPALAPATASALELDCGRGRYVVVFDRELARKGGLARLNESSAVMGAVLERDKLDDHPFLLCYLLTHPGPGNSVRLFAMTERGVVAYAGELEPEDDGAARFNVRALKTRMSQPLALEGHLRIAGKGLEFDFERAEVATSFARSQPPPMRPRRIPSVGR